VTPIPTTLALTGTPANVISGSVVTFTATLAATSGTVVPGGTITFLDNGASIGQGTLNTAGVARLPITTLAVGNHSVTAQYVATGNFGGMTSTAVPVTVAPLPDYSLAANPSSLTVASGSTGSTIITVTPLNNYAGTVRFSCGTGLPTAVVCNVAPTAVSFLTTNQAAQSVTLTITVAAQHSLLSIPADRGKSFAPMLAFLCIPTTLLGFALRRKQIAHLKKATLPALLLAIGFCSLLSLSGCGAPAKSNTVAGSYSIMITASDGTNSHPLNLTITVQ
jgi:hypothetical protein